VVEACLRDLKGSVETDPDHARTPIGKLISRTTLRRKDGHLWAEMRGNIARLLEVDDQVGNGGAGRGIWSLPNIGGVLELTSNLPLRTALVRRTTSAG
jgi:hypothetical protein